MDRALTHLEFNNERIVVLNIEPVEFSLSDLWPIDAILKNRRRNSLNSNEIQIAVHVLLSQVHGILSKNSVPYIMRLWSKLQTLVAEKLQSSRSSQSAANSPVAAPSSADLKPPPSIPKESLTRNGRLVMNDGSLLAVTVTATIRITDVRLALFKEQLDPGQDCIQLRIGEFETILMRTFTDSNTRRELRLIIAGSQPTSIRKCLKSTTSASGSGAGGSSSSTGGSTAPTGTLSNQSGADDYANWSVMQWLDHVSARSFKLILALPPSDILMESLEPAMVGGARSIPIVEYMFESRFKGAIDINLNIGFFKFLQDTASDFGGQFTAAVQSLQTRQTVSPEKSPSTIISPTLTSPVNISFDGVDYRPLKPILFEPQLKAIDGATPSDVLKWLGIQKETLPVTLHSTLTMGLERILTGSILQTYTRYCIAPHEGGKEADEAIKD
jgi:hypothetical protein